MSREVEKVELEYSMARNPPADTNAQGRSENDEGVDKDSLLILAQTQLVDLHRKVEELHMVCREKEAMIRQLQSSRPQNPQTTSPTHVTPVRDTYARQMTGDMLSRRARLTRLRDGQMDIDRPRRRQEDISPVIEPTADEVGQRMLPPPVYDDNITGARPKVRSPPTVRVHTPPSPSIARAHTPSPPVARAHTPPPPIVRAHTLPSPPRVRAHTPPSPPVAHVRTSLPPVTHAIPIPNAASTPLHQHILTIPHASPTSVLTAGPVIKPKDIVEIKLSELNDIASTTKLNLFLSDVEGCTSDEATRIKVAMTRMDDRLRVLIHNAREEGKIKSWIGLKDFMLDTFTVAMSFDQIFDATNSLTYDWSQDPHTFKNDFYYQYSNMKNTFRNKELPPRDKMLKSKLLKGLPAENQERLKSFMDKCVSIDTFMTQLQRQREILLTIQGSNVLTLNAVSPTSASCQHLPNSPPTNTCQHMPNNNSPNHNRGNNTNSRQPNNPDRSCVYCRRRGHSVRDCFLKPSYFLCFDCKKTNCFKGKAGCSGWVPHYAALQNQAQAQAHAQAQTQAHTQAQIPPPPPPGNTYPLTNNPHSTQQSYNSQE